MSRQEVNLLSSVLLPEPDRLPLSLVGKLAAAGTAAALAVTLYGQTQIATTAADIAVLQKQAVTARAEVDKLTAKNNRHAERVALNRQLEQLIGLQQQRMATLELLEGETTRGARPSLSTYLAGVAEAHVPGLWITQVAVDLRTDALQIGGAAEAPSRIPSFLTQLRTTSAFAESSVGGLEMRASEAGAVGFLLRGAPG